MSEEENRFRMMVESSLDWFWEFDENANFTYVSPRIRDMLGYEPEELIGLNAFDLMNADEAERVRKHFDPIAKKYLPFNHLENINIHKNGHQVVIESSGTPIFDGEGHFRGYRGIDRDITARKAYEAALLAATQAAEAASQAKDMFLAQVSHEIRTPMTAIVGFGELLEDAELSSDEREYLAALNASSKVLSSMIKDILDLSKVEAGELAIKSESFSLRPLISKVINMQGHQIIEKNLLLNVNLGADVPGALIGDSLRIKQVLLNLLGNAVKFTDEGSIDLSITVAEENLARVLLDISVKDTGIGIPEDLQENIFEPFVQGDKYTHSGAGLGLTISRSLAALMGGTLLLESQPGVGSTFHLLIPLKVKVESLSEKNLPEAEPLPWSGPTLKILLAEDNPINSQFMTIVLENMGHVVTHAGNGKVALDALKVNSFELVLMDIEMPLMTGVDALHAIRHLEQASGNSLTVIAMTAYALIGDKEKYLKMGFDDYLSKPFKTKELVDVLKRFISSRVPCVEGTG